jgi:hypothetical protein
MPRGTEGGSMFRSRRKMTIISGQLFIILAVIFESGYTFQILGPAQAESGIGKDIFKVVVSIFGVTKDTGDIAATVTVNGNSRVKSFHFDHNRLSGGNSSSEYSTLEFVAAFPNVVVNSGDVYKACVLRLSDMHHFCEEGKNSPAKRAEFVDILLDKNAKRQDPPKQSDPKDLLPNFYGKK